MADVTFTFPPAVIIRANNAVAFSTGNAPDGAATKEYFRQLIIGELTRLESQIKDKALSDTITAQTVIDDAATAAGLDELETIT